MDGLLPELPIKDIVVKVKEEEFRKFIENCQNYALFCNKEVKADKLEEHPIIKGVKYLPISYMQSMLDTVFFGLWQETNFRWQIIANEITAAIDLKVYHIYLKEWLIRTGASAIQIMVDAIPEKDKKNLTKKEINKWSLDLANKKPGALANGVFAALKAECFKNACLSIGKLFGRDVNRKLTDAMMPIIPKTDDITLIRKELSKLLTKIKDQSKRKKLITYISKIEEKGENTYVFYESMIKNIE